MSPGRRTRLHRQIEGRAALWGCVVTGDHAARVGRRRNQFWARTAVIGFFAGHPLKRAGERGGGVRSFPGPSLAVVDAIGGALRDLSSRTSSSRASTVAAASNQREESGTADAVTKREPRRPSPAPFPDVQVSSTSRSSGCG